MFSPGGGSGAFHRRANHHTTATFYMGDTLDWDRIDAAQLTGDIREVAETHGIEVVEKLVSTFGGCMIYIPTCRDLKRRHLADRAADLYDGTNAASVCRALRVSRRTLNKLLAEVAEAGTSETGTADGNRAAA
jgi:hypothetical protein